MAGSFGNFQKLCIPGILVLTAVMLAADAHASGFRVLHAFEGKSDGSTPLSGLLLVGGSNLLGTTVRGGTKHCSKGCGTVDATSIGGGENVFFDFDGKNGEYPSGSLISDDGGNLYGTSQLGGANGHGNVFELAADGKETVLYSFCPRGSCSDGAGPIAGLVEDGNGNLYGTTSLGGSAGDGTVFELSPEKKEEVLYSFKGGFDGSGPSDSLVLDGDGDLYGTTDGGGAYEGGAVFRITPKGKESLLYSFCANRYCTDGESPHSSVIFDNAGNLYGTTAEGGLYQGGVVFKITPAGTETTLYSFCAVKDCADGDEPEGALIADGGGNVFGTTVYGGMNNAGSVFEITSAGKELVLYSFCSAADCSDGELPYDTLVADGAGTLYGTTSAGGLPKCVNDQGESGCGTIFSLKVK
jgi:uncharacterized repeat protein (TIGR03803 family)